MLTQNPWADPVPLSRRMTWVSTKFRALSRAKHRPCQEMIGTKWIGPPLPPVVAGNGQGSAVAQLHGIDWDPRRDGRGRIEWRPVSGGYPFSVIRHLSITSNWVRIPRFQNAPSVKDPLFKSVTLKSIWPELVSLNLNLSPFFHQINQSFAARWPVLFFFALVVHGWTIVDDYK